MLVMTGLQTNMMNTNIILKYELNVGKCGQIIDTKSLNGI